MAGAGSTIHGNQRPQELGRAGLTYMFSFSLSRGVVWSCLLYLGSLASQTVRGKRSGDYCQHSVDSAGMLARPIRLQHLSIIALMRNLTPRALRELYLFGLWPSPSSGLSKIEDGLAVQTS